MKWIWAVFSLIYNRCQGLLETLKCSRSWTLAIIKYESFPRCTEALSGCVNKKPCNSLFLMKSVLGRIFQQTWCSETKPEIVNHIYRNQALKPTGEYQQHLKPNIVHIIQILKSEEGMVECSSWQKTNVVMRLVVELTLRLDHPCFDLKLLLLLLHFKKPKPPPAFLSANGFLPNQHRGLEENHYNISSCTAA